ncbi:MAG: MFS transporter [Firmicutes bacterium]|nr:MFS transporter [Bacillota bacterium]
MAHLGFGNSQEKNDNGNDYYAPGTAAFRRASLALFIASFVIFANIHIAQPLLPILAQEFAVSPAVSSLTVSVTIFSIGLALLIYGPMSDAVGRRPVMLWTMLLGVLPALLVPLVTTFDQLLVIRVAQGLLLAGLPSVAMAYLGEEISPRALGLALGLYISGNTIGGMSGRVISGVVADVWSWQASFVVLGFIGLAGVFLFYLLLPPSRHFVPRAAGWRLGAAATFSHLRNATLLKAFGIAFLLMFIFMGVFTYIAFRLSAPPYDLSPAALGWVFVVYLAGTFSSAITGRFVDVAGHRAGIIKGVLVALSGVLLMLMQPLWVIVAGLLVFCYGFFAAHTSASAWVNGNAKQSRASAAGLYLVFFYAGGSFGSTGLGFVWHPWAWPGVTVGLIISLLIAMVIGFTVKDNWR